MKSVCVPLEPPRSLILSGSCGSGPYGATSVDDRRRRWIPLSVEFPFDKTGTHLQDQYGPAGLGMWVALLTACKRAPIQGTFSYTTDADAWEKLGIVDPPCTFEEFVAFTGRIKKTKKRARGRIKDVQITGWEQWNNTQKTRPGRSDSPRSEAEIRSREDAYESDSESDIEIEESNPFFKFLKRGMT